MKTSSTFSILFWADFSRVKDNQASLYLAHLEDSLAEISDILGFDDYSYCSRVFKLKTRSALANYLRFLKINHIYDCMPSSIRQENHAFLKAWFFGYLEI